jgi:hypothetical protein
MLLRGAPAAADPQPGDLTLVRITVDDLEVASAEAIQVLRFGEFTASPAAPAQALHVGDEVLCPDARVAVRLTGIDGEPQVSMRGPFRVALAPRPDGSGAPLINLLGGEVHVTSIEETSVRAGEVLIGSRGTTYGVKVERTGETPTVETFVFEGGVDVRTPDGTVPVVADAQARMLRYAGAGRPAVSVVPAAAVEATARLYGVLDYDEQKSKARGVDGKQAVAELTAAYAQSLANPQGGSMQLDLATQKARLGSTQGIGPLLDRVDLRRNPELTAQKVLVQVGTKNTRGANPEQLAEQLRQIQRTAPELVQRYLPEEGAAQVTRWLDARQIEGRVRDLLRQGRYAEARPLAEGLDGKGRPTVYLSLFRGAVSYRDPDGARRYGTLAMQRDAETWELDAVQQHGLFDLWRLGHREGPAWPPHEPWAFRLLEMGLNDDAAFAFRWLRRQVGETSRTLYGLGLALSRSRDPRDGAEARALMRRALELAEKDRGLTKAEMSQALRVRGSR